MAQPDEKNAPHDELDSAFETPILVPLGITEREADQVELERSDPVVPQTLGALQGNHFRRVFIIKSAQNPYKPRQKLASLKTDASQNAKTLMNPGKNCHRWKSTLRKMRKPL